MPPTAKGTVKIDGDGSDAERALEGVAKEAKQTEKALDDAGQGGLDMGKAMAGAAVAAAALAAAGAAVTASIQAFAATNQSAADTLGGLGERMRLTQVAIGDAVFQSDGFQEAMGRVDQALRFVAANADTLANVVSGALNFAIDASIVAIDAWNAAVAGAKTIAIVAEATVDAMATTFVTLGMDIRTTSNAVLDFGLSIAQAVISPLADAARAVQGFIEQAAPLAAFAGIDLGGVASSVAEFAGDVDGTVASLQAMRDAAAESTRQTRALREETEQAYDQRQADRVEGIVRISEELDQQLQATAGSASGAVEGIEALGRQARQSAGGVAALVVELNKLAEGERLAEEARKARVQAAVDAASGKEAAGLAGAEAERMAAEAAKYAQAEQMAADHAMRMAFIEEQRKADVQAQVDQRAEIASQERAIVMESYLAIAGVAASGGKLTAKAAAMAVKGVLDAKAIEQLLLGAANLIPPPFNPTGNPLIGARQIALGGAMKVASAGLGAIAGMSSGGGQGLSAAGSGSVALPGPASTANAGGQGSTVVNMGIVGDPRAAANMVVDMLDSARREGRVPV